MRITMYARPKQAWFALIQLAITGIYGGIDGTLLNRGGEVSLLIKKMLRI
jgi:hypothetical protein